MQIKGKQVKDYIFGDTIVSQPGVQLLSGQTVHGQPISILMIQKNQIEQASFVAYNNLLVENSKKIHPRYIQPVQSPNNIYLIIQALQKIDLSNVSSKDILHSLVHLYRNIGEYKIEVGDLFVTQDRRVVYLPFYKYMHASSKFYSQFNNKSILGQIFARTTSLSNKNRALEIFIQNIDSPHAEETITKLIENQGTQGVFKSKLGFNDKNVYPDLDINEEAVDEQIMKLMSEVKVNSDLQQQAANFSKRQSVKKFQEESDKQLNNILEQAKSSIAIIKKGGRSQYLKSKMQGKVSASKIEGNQFDLYFRSYYESLHFLKKAIKVFLEYYHNGFAGVVSSYLIVTILTLRKAYMIKDLQCGIDIFELGISMVNVPVNKYIAIISSQLKKQARMIVELRTIIENCKMPMKTFSILAPFLEEDISLIDLDNLQSFAFFFLSSLMKGRDKSKVHFMYFIDIMYILLHRNYEIAFFQSEFPGKWDKEYFQRKVTLIEAILPSWELQ